MRSVINLLPEPELVFKFENLKSGLNGILVTIWFFGTNKVSKVDGYYKNDLIKILFPPEAPILSVRM